MRAETSELVDQLVTVPLRVDTAQPAEGERCGRHTPGGARRTTRRARTSDPPVGFLKTTMLHTDRYRRIRVAVSLPDPGTVEVRLLTPTPRLEGLREELAPEPGPAGHGARGLPRPPYGRRGDQRSTAHARPRVLRCRRRVQDVVQHRRGGAAGHGLRCAGDASLSRRNEERDLPGRRRASRSTCTWRRPSPPREARPRIRTEAMALLRFALNLVEGEPLSNVLSGYGWWEAEGHGARTAAVLVHAAGNLAALAVEAEDFELAQWGLGQARLVDPYSEALSRVAMQVAAAAGDADRLRREWRECRRRIDELDPGARPRRAPSGSTANWRNACWSASPAPRRLTASRRHRLGADGPLRPASRRSTRHPAAPDRRHRRRCSGRPVGPALRRSCRPAGGRTARRGRSTGSGPTSREWC